MGSTVDSRFRTVVAPGFGTPPPPDRPRSAAGRLGNGPGPGAYDVVGGVVVGLEIELEVWAASRLTCSSVREMKHVDKTCTLVQYKSRVLGYC